MKVGVVGAGYFAQFHYDAWARLPGAELVALVEHDPERASTTAGQFGVPRTFSNLEDLLADGGIELLDIVTPPQTHKQLVQLGAQADLPMVCQKPLAPTLDEACEIVELAEAADTPLIVHENFRFQPWYRHAKRMIEDGRFGALHSISFRLRPGDGQGPEAYLERQPYFQGMARFLVHETGVHFVDVFRFLMGEVSAVTARLRKVNPVIAGEDAGYILFEFEGGQTGLFDGNRLNEHHAENKRLTMGEMWLEGERGVLRLDGDGGLWWQPHGGEERAEPYDWSNQGFAGDCVFAFCDHVLEGLTGQGDLENTGREYLRNMEIVEAVYRSHEEGVRIVV